MTPRQESVEYDGVLLTEVWGLPEEDLELWLTDVMQDHRARGCVASSWHSDETAGHHLVQSYRETPSLSDAMVPRWFGGAW